MELQHVNIKLYLDEAKPLELKELIPVFHTWIQDQLCDELLIDVADYGHVHAGPGVVLIGHEADYSVENIDTRLGLRYNRKAAVAGDNQDRFHQALRSALTACQRLESDARLEGKVRFNGRGMQLSVNDRMLAPNLSETYSAVKPDLEVFFQRVFEGEDFTLKHNRDPRSLFSVEIRTSKAYEPATLLQRLL